jgi:ABC-type branched-subunit amino acid transport system ATPase component
MTAPAGNGVEVAAALLSVANVSLAFGGVKALTDVSFDVRKGEIRAIIGPNGAGKTSMLNVINGFYNPQQGRITFKGKTRARMRPYEAARGGIARTFQNVALFRGMTALDNLMVGRTLKMRRTASRSRRSSTFSRSLRSARRRSAACPTVCKSASSLGAPSRWSRTSCCSTSRWPA